MNTLNTMFCAKVVNSIQKCWESPLQETCIFEKALCNDRVVKPILKGRNLNHFIEKQLRVYSHYSPEYACLHVIIAIYMQQSNVNMGLQIAIQKQSNGIYCIDDWIVSGKVNLFALDRENSETLVELDEKQASKHLEHSISTFVGHSIDK